MATYRFELNAKPNRNKKYNILLCVTIAGKRKRIKTDIYLSSKKHFNSKCRGNNWVRESEPSHKAWNEALADLLEDARKTYKELKEDEAAPTADNVARLVKGEEQPKLFLRVEDDGMAGFAAEKAQEIYNAGGIANWKKYNGLLNKLAGFLDKEMKHKKELLFSEITLEFVTRFDAYLHTLHNSRSKKEATKKLHPNTIAVILNKFNTLMRKGMKLGYISPDKNPFLVFEYEREKPTTKEKLNASEIQALEALELEEGSLDWHSRNCFLFSFYCAGIRAGDLLQLRWLNVEGGRLNYQMGKNHKERDLLLVPQAAAILVMYRTGASKPTDYVFPFMDNRKTYAGAITQADKDTLPSDLKRKLYEDISAKNALINKSLKRLAEKADISKKLSMHISRHSFASVAAQKGLTGNQVKGLLAHSRLQTTEGYMGNFTTDENDKALESVFASMKQPTDKKAQLLALIQGMSDEDVAAVLKTINNPKTV